MTTVLVTGATGTVGRHLLPALVERGVRVRALVRDPDRLLAGPARPEVEPVVGDLADPAALRRALVGVDHVFLATANHPHQLDHEIAVIDAAAGAGVTRLVKLSAAGAAAGSPVAFWRVHALAEDHLRRSGLPGCVLRPTAYLSNLLASAGSVGSVGRVFAPAGAAAPPMIDPRDVADVAAALLARTVLTPEAAAVTDPGGRTHVLTGPEPLTYREFTAHLARALDREVTFVDVPDDVAAAAMTDAGVPGWLAGEIVNVWRALRAGDHPAPTDTVRCLTGRAPRTAADFCRDHAGAFAAGAAVS